jgi:hypothetical protein
MAKTVAKIRGFREPTNFIRHSKRVLDVEEYPSQLPQTLPEHIPNGHTCSGPKGPGQYKGCGLQGSKGAMKLELSLPIKKHAGNARNVFSLTNQGGEEPSMRGLSSLCFLLHN